MVGVKGKYKGCNTCRSRRVKCSNERPFCRKCTDHGRVCEGYEKETVFIVGTVDDKGRCASHPARNLQAPKKPRTSAGPSKTVKEEFSPVNPLQAAWNETLLLASVGGLREVRFVALHTVLDPAIRQPGNPGDGAIRFSLLPSQRVDVRPLSEQDGFRLNAQYFISMPQNDDGQRSNSAAEGLYLILYEQNSSAAHNSKAPWKDSVATSSPIRQLGPNHFQAFPAHHFFVRIYRPSAIFASLLNPQTCHISSPEWTIVPWESHPKSPLDHLLDITALIPGLLSRADRIIPFPPSIGRRIKARDLLNNCLCIEQQFEVWYSGVDQAAAINKDNPLLYWAAKPSARGSQMPFADTFEFPSPALGLAHIYHWTSLVVLYGCMHTLLHAIFENSDPAPVVDFANVYPDLPPSVDPLRYRSREIRKLAANVCRSLDWALGLGQPDLVVAPLWIVKQFYVEVGDGELEISWCENFRARMVERGLEVEKEIEGRAWVEIGNFG